MLSRSPLPRPPLPGRLLGLAVSLLVFSLAVWVSPELLVAVVLSVLPLIVVTGILLFIVRRIGR